MDIKINKKILYITLLGNILEFYNLGLCGFFALTITPLFFPSNDPFALMISGMGVFAAGFLMRPFGAMIFGYIGDKFGRKISLSSTVLLMAVPTFLIAILPTYAQVGIIAPIILMLCRLMQGVCAGGEYNNAAIFMLEHTHPSKQGLYSGLMTASSILGFFLSSSMVLLVAHLPLSSALSWRIPFLLGTFIGIIGFYLRRSNILESPVFEKKNNDISLKENLKLNKGNILCVIAVGWLAGTLSLSLVGYMASYLTAIVQLSRYQSSFISSLGLMIYMLFLPVMGGLSDKVGHRKLMQIASGLTLLLSYPLFALLTTGSLPFVIAGEVGLALLASMFLGPMHAYMLSIFPVQFRCRGISTSFSVGIAFLGGTAPLISTLLIQQLGFNEAPALYFALSAVAGLIAMSCEDFSN